MARPPHECLGCGRPTVRPGRCRACIRVKNATYRRPEYLAQPSTGTCWICGRPIGAGEGSRDHVVPVRLDPRSLSTRPAHRVCNSARRDRILCIPTPR